MQVIGIITVVVIISTATTLTGFVGITPAFTTPIATGTTEEVDIDADESNTTAIASPTSVQDQHDQPIHIIKDGTTSYIISGGSSSVGSFDTTYRIAGESSTVRASESLIISTITSDYNSSLTIGYVMVGNINATTASIAGPRDGGNSSNRPNSFATPEQISEKIASELRRVIGETDVSNSDDNMTTLQEGGEQQPIMEIKCVFGMELNDMRCDDYIPSAGAMEDIADLTPSTPLEDDQFETDSRFP